MFRCDGKCDAEAQLETPFRVSPEEINPPLEYRKKVRVVDFKNDAYLNTAMNDSIDNYQECLISLGYPYNIPQHIKGIKFQENESSKENLSLELSTVLHRSCGVITSYIMQCMPILTKCLSISSAEIIRAKDAKWIVTQVKNTIAEFKNASFHHTDCQIFGGKISSATYLQLQLCFCFLIFVCININPYLQRY